MVAPIGNIVNKFPFFSFSSSTMSKQQSSTLPTVFLSNDTGMDKSTGLEPANNNEVRGRILTTSSNLSRESSIASSGRSTPYCDRMNNRMDCDSISGDMAPELSYENEQDKALRTSKAANPQDTTRTLTGNNKANQSHVNHEESVFNVQLPYGPHAPMEPDLWSESFHSISLHGSIEHFASDSKSIKDSLNFMSKYITNKQVNGKDVNDFTDFDGMGDIIWNFISSVYEAKWDALNTDNKTNTLRTKILSKFTIKTKPSNNNRKESAKTVPMSIKKSPPVLNPPLPTKLKSEVNTISKYFKGKKPTSNQSKPSKSYVQALKPTASTSDVLKIKDSFPALTAKQIDRVNNIVKGNPTPKPHIQMTTKGPSRKQVIVPMSTDNNTTFTKNSALHMANINRVLKNTKSDIAADFIRSDANGPVIVTNKVANQSDLQIISQYIRRSEDINELQVDEPCLPQSKSYLKIIGIPFFPNSRSQD